MTIFERQYQRMACLWKVGGSMPSILVAALLTKLKRLYRMDLRLFLPPFWGRCVSIHVQRKTPQ